MPTRSPRHPLLLLPLIAACGAASMSTDHLAVRVIPPSLALGPGSSHAFAAAVAGAASLVTWSVQEGTAGGSVTAGGIYTAPASPGTFHLVATAVADPKQQGVAVVTVTPPSAVSVSISPQTVSLTTGGSLDFTCTVTGSTNPGCNWALRESGAGVIDPATGYYVAPGATGVYHLVVTAKADPTASAVATITVTAPTQPPPLTGTVTAATMASLASRAWLFAHRSIGQNVLEGVFRFSAYGPSGFKVYGNSLAGDAGNFDSTGRDTVNGHMNEYLVGQNNDPYGKWLDFDRMMRGGMGAKLNALHGFAIIKINGTDFFPGGQATIATQIQSVQDAIEIFQGTGAHAGRGYRTIMDKLEADFPNVTFIHVTVPLYTYSNGAWIQGGHYPNQFSTAFSDQMRATYPANRVFDLAEWQCTHANGTRALSPDNILDAAGNHIRVLAEEYNYDGIHMNAAGSDWTAAKFALFLEAATKAYPYP